MKMLLTTALTVPPLAPTNVKLKLKMRAYKLCCSKRTCSEANRAPSMTSVIQKNWPEKKYRIVLVYQTNQKNHPGRRMYVKKENS